MIIIKYMKLNLRIIGFKKSNLDDIINMSLITIIYAFKDLGRENTTDKIVYK